MSAARLGRDMEELDSPRQRRKLIENLIGSPEAAQYIAKTLYETLVPDYLRPKSDAQANAAMRQFQDAPAGAKVPQVENDLLEAAPRAMADMLIGGGMGGAGKAAAALPLAALRRGVVKEAPQGIRAYHGSPHDFDKFDISKIGTGEGAQAYGHGLYFAERPEVARDYRTRLTPYGKLDIGGQSVTTSEMPEGARKVAAQLLVSKGFEGADARFAAHNLDRSLFKDFSRDDVIREIDNLLSQGAKSPGRMYEVNIRANPEQFLDWDRPLGQQAPVVDQLRGRLPQAVQSVTQRTIGPSGDWEYSPRLTGSLLYDRLVNEVDKSAVLAGKPNTSANVGKMAATDVLHEAGIPGIKYLDQGSRNPGFSSLKPAQLDARIETLQADIASGGGDQKLMRDRLAMLERERDTYRNQTHNYVLFDDSIVEILRKYGLAGLAIPGAAMMARQDEQ
jgi:hypothetical protein